jgi:hypothetical protein
VEFSLDPVALERIFLSAAISPANFYFTNYFTFINHPVFQHCIVLIMRSSVNNHILSVFHHLEMRF